MNWPHEVFMSSHLTLIKRKGEPMLNDFKTLAQTDKHGKLKFREKSDPKSQSNDTSLEYNICLFL
jgi:hypothetical protein